MSASAILRIINLTLWLGSSLGGMVFALTHFFPARRNWTDPHWQTDPVNLPNAAFHWFLAKMFLACFGCLVFSGLVALFFPRPGPPPPASVGSMLSTYGLIAANFILMFGIRYLKNYERKQREGNGNGPLERSGDG